MLHELNIENYAVVEKLRVHFRPGLNLLTGETGSGKSIVVDALSLLLGARASSEVVRAGSRRARVAGIFEIEEAPSMRALLEQAGWDLEQGELIVEREILDNGKTRAYVNGRAATINLLRDLAPWLGDIHGQHEQQSLFSTRAQLEMLDAFAGVAGESEQLAEIYRRWRQCDSRLQELRGNEREKQRQLDLCGFQSREIEQAQLEPGEDERLEQEQRVLSNLEKVQQAAAAAYDLLYDSASSVLSQLRAARRQLDELARFDPKTSTWIESLESARAVTEDAAFDVRTYLEGLDADPDRLNELESRLAQIERLKRKYGQTLQEVIVYGEQMRRRVEELESSDATIAEIEKEQQALGADYQQRADQVSRRRHEAAARLEKMVEHEMASLEMARARFRVSFEPVEAGFQGWSSHGFDRIAFLVSANPGQPPRPLAQVASGGELSRITLALKTCLIPAGKSNGSKRKTAPGASRRAASPRTLVFDEIDTGVGGRVAEAVGRRLKRLADTHQVLCVTHLPQIAGLADTHFFVGKEEQGGATFASIQELSDKQRVEELARMLSGAEITAAALENARQLLQRARKAAAGE
jgi:DNA repair protein RecN (Recombination protein N)